VRAETVPSWEEHSAAAAEMGLDVRTAYETYDGPEAQLRRATAECLERLRRTAEELESPNDGREDQR
jgi:hypothetical protein